MTQATVFVKEDHTVVYHGAADELATAHITNVGPDNLLVHYDTAGNNYEVSAGGQMVMRSAFIKITGITGTTPKAVVTITQ